MRNVFVQPNELISIFLGKTFAIDDYEFYELSR